MTGYIRHFVDKKKPSKVDKRISFKADDKELFKRYMANMGKISNSLVINFVISCIMIRCINSKIKIINDEIKTNFHDKETPKPKIAYDCFSVISLDSDIKANDMYNPQVYFEEYQYRIKNNEKKNWLNKTFVVDLSDTDSENDSEPDSDADDN